MYELNALPIPAGPRDDRPGPRARRAVLTPASASAIEHRPASARDVPALERLIAASARDLGRGFYTDEQTEAAVAHVFGVDSELVADGTYLVATRDGALAGCGGWSRRATLFGGDRYAGRVSGLLDPARDAARIRAFFVAPGHARRGVATALLRRCEADSAAAGFTRAALLATLPGEPFYLAHGYRAGERLSLTPGGVDVPFTPMERGLLRESNIDSRN